jgi:hypothetical protein
VLRFTDKRKPHRRRAMHFWAAKWRWLHKICAQVAAWSPLPLLSAIASILIV